MLELIFRGFIEWIYGMVLECWEYFSSALLDIMSLDFAYLRSYVPVIPDIMQIILAIGWALLLGNLVFQAARSMLSGLGFEGEDPKLLFARTFVFAFLLMASPQICELGLSLTSNMMALLEVPDALNVQLVDESTFDGLGAAWLLVILFGVVIMFKTIKLILEIAERYVILAMLTITAPLAFATGGSRSTSDIFTGWCRMYGSMCLLMVTNVVFFRMLLSVLSTVPRGLDVVPWMALILAIVKVAQKADAIITRIGLNPALTGGGSGRSLPGMLTYAIIRSAATGAAKAFGKSMGGRGATGSTPPGGGPRTGGPFGTGHTSSAGTAGTRAGSGGAAASSPGNGAGGPQSASSRQSTTQQAGGPQTHTQQGGTYQSTTQQGPAQSFQQDGAGQSSGYAQSTETEQSTSSAHTFMGQTRPGTDNNSSQTRKTAVPPGTRRAPSHVKTTVGGAPKPGTAGGGKAAPTAGMSTSGGTGGRPGRAAFSTSEERVTPNSGTHATAAEARQGQQSGAAGTTAAPMPGRTQAAGAAPQPSGERTASPGHSAGTTETQTSRSTRRTEVSGSRGAYTASAPARHGTAGTAAPSEHSPRQEPRHGRNTPPSTTEPSRSGDRSGTARQESRTTIQTATPTGNAPASASKPGTAGTAPEGQQVRRMSATAKRSSVKGKTGPSMTEGSSIKRPAPSASATRTGRTTHRVSAKPPDTEGGQEHGR